MKTTFLLSVFVLIWALQVSAKSEPNEDDVKQFLQNASTQLYKLYDDINALTFDPKKQNDQLSLVLQLTKLKIASDELRELSQQARSLENVQTNDAETKQALKNLRRMGDVYVLGIEAHTLSERLQKLHELIVSTDIDSYGENDNTTLAYYPHIEAIIQNSDDADELKYYWEAWREKNGLWATENFYEIIELLKKAAGILDMNVLQYWYAHYNIDYIMEMEDVMEKLRPLYRELHAYVRDKLFKIYGAGVIKPHGPIPDHIFQQVLSQVWHKKFILDDEFPFEHLPPYDSLIRQLQPSVNSPKDLLRLADKFYESVGFDKFADDFWYTNVTLQSANSTSDCKAQIMDMTPAVHIKYCNRIDFRTFMQAHREIGRAHYAQEKRNLPAYFFESYGLEKSVGEAVILSASSLTHLKSIGLVKEFNQDVMLNRLSRMGIHTLFSIPIFYVHSKLMQDFLLGSIQKPHLNQYYWKLMEVYAGIEPPCDRFNSSLDFPNSFYVGLKNNEVTSKFTSEVLGYQFYKALCKKNAYTGELSNCDFHNGVVAGLPLKEMMSLGSSKPWREVISKVLGESSTLSADPVLEYYKPFENWIVQKNKEKKISIGWDDSVRQLSKQAFTSEVDARKFVDDSKEKIKNIFEKISSDLFNARDHKGGEVDFWKLSDSAVAANQLRDISKQANQYDVKNFKSKETRRAIQNLGKVADMFVLGKDLGKCRSFRQALNDLTMYPGYTPFGGKKGQPASIAFYPEVEQIFINSTNPEELKYYWVDWRNNNARYINRNLMEMFHCIRDAAEVLELPIMNFWYKQYSKDFLREMTAVITEIRPFYRSLHSFIRNELIRKYGAATFNSQGPIPDHLFQQVLAQAWTPGSIVEHYFPITSLPPYDSFIASQNYSANGVLKVAENFYTSIGFAELQKSFWEKRLKLHDEATNKGDCKVEIYDLAPKAYMKYCAKVNFRTFLQSHGYLARIHYAKEKDVQPAYFFPSYNLEYPIGEAVILSASTPTHLKTMKLSGNYTFTDSAILNRLIRMSIHTMLNLHMHYVQAKVLNDYWQGKVKDHQLNAYYWKQMDEIAGIEPPVDRPDGVFDFNFKFFTDLETNFQVKKFVSEVLGYQFYRELCKKAKQEPLHLCDFYGSLLAGNSVKKLMAKGSSRPWRQTIRKLLPSNPKLNADAILEYYLPVMEWLKLLGSRLGSDLFDGWYKSDKKVGNGKF